jgi:hypothetical protein
VCVFEHVRESLCMYVHGYTRVSFRLCISVCALMCVRGRELQCTCVSV